MYKLLLIQPSQYSSTGKLIKQKRIYLPGLVFPLLAAMVPGNWKVEVKIEVVEDIDLNTDADLVGIGAMGHALIRAFEISKAFRERGKIVFLGGYMVSLLPDYALNFADSVVVGDAEISFPKLLKDFEETGKLERIYDNPIDRLEGLPVPKYSVLLGKPIGDMLPVQAARGCPHSCSFCSIACLYRGRYLVRPVEEVIRDIMEIKRLGFSKFYLIDDNIAGNQSYLEELCRRIRPLRMSWATQCTMNIARNDDLLRLVAGSGCRILSLGIESITQEGLDRLNKKWLRTEQHEKLIKAFRRAGIMISAEMIIGTDGDTVDSIRSTVRFITRNRLPLVRVYILTPVYGSPHFNRLKAEGRIIREEHRYYDAAHCVHIPEKISPDELEKEYHRLNHRLFSLGNILKRTVFLQDFIRFPGRHLVALAINLHYRKAVSHGDTPIII